MRSARILFKDSEAGILTQHDDGSFSFCYHEAWIADSSKANISATLPKSKREFHAPALFPFFFHLLPEGVNRQMICRLNKFDPDDDFGLLMTAAKNDSIGAVRVIKIDNP